MLKKLNMDKFRILCAIFIIAIHTYPFVTVNQNLEIIFTHIILKKENFGKKKHPLGAFLSLAEKCYNLHSRICR